MTVVAATSLNLVSLGGAAPVAQDPWSSLKITRTLGPFFPITLAPRIRTGRPRAPHQRGKR